MRTNVTSGDWFSAVLWHAVEFLTIHFNYFLRMWEGEGRADCAVLYFFSSAGKRGIGGGGVDGDSVSLSIFVTWLQKQHAL